MGHSPAGKNVSTEADDIAGIRHQATTGEDTADQEDLTMCCSELQIVWISVNAIVTWSYNTSFFNKSDHQSNPSIITHAWSNIM
jgi:hypothetical protein